MHGNNYAVEQRLRFIDFLLYQYGSINRSALMEYFGISAPQATKDIADYLKLKPNNCIYNGKLKAYVITSKFTKVF